MTTLVRFRDPLRNVARNGEFERLIQTLLESPARAAALSNHARTPPLDVWETEGELVYAFDLPGIPEDRISIEFEDGALTVSAERGRTEQTENDRFYRFERRFGSFTRTLGLPQGIKDSDISASSNDGVLEIHVTKPEETKPQRIKIGVGSSPATIEGTAKESN